MSVWLKSLFRHFQIRHLGALLLSNAVCFAVFAGALAGPLIVRDPGLGLVILVAGFLLTGQAAAVSGRLLDVRFRRQTPQRGGLPAAWRLGWAEGLVLGVFLLVVFSLLFRSVPYYWEQGTLFSEISLGVLGLGVLLLLGGVPYFFPVRRRETLGIAASAVRAFRLMNARPLEALACAAFSLLFLAASAGTLGLFPGWSGLAALHQGSYDRIRESLDSAEPADPGTSP